MKLDRMFQIIRIFACIFAFWVLCSCIPDSDRFQDFDLITQAEWSASLKNKLEKSNIQKSFLKSKKEKLNIEANIREKESKDWKLITRFPINFNFLFLYRNNPDFTK